MTALRQSLQDALILASNGAPEEAIKALEIALTQAIQSGETRWASLIGRNLALICEHEGKLQAAIEYLRKLVEAQTTDRRSIYQLAGLLEKLGDDVGARQAFAEALILARSENDDELLELLRSKGFE